MEISKVLKSRS